MSPTSSNYTHKPYPQANRQNIPVTKPALSNWQLITGNSKFQTQHLLRLLPLLLLFTVSSYAQLQGKVIAIADGDTFTWLMAGKQQRVRLYGIDCPEKAQDFGKVAKQFLADLIFNKEVTLIKKGTDRYGRLLGIVYANGENVNEALLTAGIAWHYKTYDHNPKWAKLEQNARTTHKGLWIIKDPIAPWIFRKNKKTKQLTKEVTHQRRANSQ